MSAKSKMDLCRCCHSEGSFKNLYTPYFWLDVEKVVYSSMLRECFNIELVEMRESYQEVLCAICYTCIQRLEDAVKFRRQVLKCEKRFQDVYSGCLNKEPTVEVTIKQEILDPEESILFESAACHNGVTTVLDDGDHAGDGDISGANMGFNTDEEKFGEKLVLGRSSKKPKKLAKVKKKAEVVKEPEPIRDEDVLETIEGIKVVRRTIVKRGVDFKSIENGFQCQKCPQIKQTSHGIRLHIRTAHFKIDKYKCPKCLAGFSTVAMFTKHKLDEHEIDDRFKCNACDHSFNTKVQLKKHKNSFHMLGEKIKCKECNYETFSAEALYKHKFKHKTVKDNQCKYCRKAFARKTTLQLHERIHTGDRRKVCAVCGQAFVQKASLNYHMTKYHPEVVF